MPEKIELHLKFCLDQLETLKTNYEKILKLVKKEVKNRNYVCATNHAVFCDNAKKLLIEIGELQ